MDLVGRDGKEDNNGGFQYVARKSKASRKRRKGKEDANSDDEEKKLAKRIDIISAQKVFLSTGATGESIKALLDDVFSSKCKDQWPSSILTLGLGSVKDSRVAQIQLAFLILVRDKLQSKESQGIVKVEAYDPIFEAEDEQLLHAYGIETSSTNLQGNYVLDHSVFIFMPHCTKTLYENILRSNWNPTALNRLWLCCNELARYVDDRRDAESTTPCIQRYVSRSSVHRLPQLPSSHSGALNDLAMQRYRLPSSATADELAEELSRTTLRSDDSFFDLPEPPTVMIKDPELL